MDHRCALPLKQALAAPSVPPAAAGRDHPQWHHNPQWHQEIQHGSTATCCGGTRRCLAHLLFAGIMDYGSAIRLGQRELVPKAERGAL